ncbi:MAG TPA: hypothetical protein VGL38_13100 [bacterium]|jgi:hypothetical protein
MRRTLALLLIIEVTLCLTARAEIPLNLKASFYVPSAWGLDVQHWVSDTTFGWAALNADTIVYCPAVGDSIRRWLISDSLFSYSGLPLHPQHNAVKLLRLNVQPDHLYVVLHSQAEDEFGVIRLLYLFLIDLTTGQVRGAYSCTGSRWEDYGMYSYSEMRTLDKILPWPPPPETAQDIFVIYRETDADRWDGGAEYPAATNRTDKSCEPTCQAEASAHHPSAQELISPPSSAPARTASS